MVTVLETMTHDTGPTPDLLESGLVKIVRDFFHPDQPNRVRDPQLQDLVWEDDEKTTDLWVNTMEYFNERNPSLRPAINVKVGDVDFSHTLMGNGMLFNEVGTGIAYRTFLGKAPFVVNVRDTSKKMAWKISSALGFRMQEAAILIQNEMMLSRFTVKKITSPKKQKTDDYSSSAQGTVDLEHTFTTDEITED